MEAFEAQLQKYDDQFSGGPDFPTEEELDRELAVLFKDPEVLAHLAALEKKFPRGLDWALGGDDFGQVFFRLRGAMLILAFMLRFFSCQANFFNFVKNSYCVRFRGVELYVGSSHCFFVSERFVRIGW